MHISGTAQRPCRDRFLGPPLLISFDVRGHNVRPGGNYGWPSKFLLTRVYAARRISRPAIAACPTLPVTLKLTAARRRLASCIFNGASPAQGCSRFARSISLGCLVSYFFVLKTPAGRISDSNVTFLTVPMNRIAYSRFVQNH